MERVTTLLSCCWLRNALYTAVMVVIIYTLCNKWRAFKYYFKYYSYLICCTLVASTSMLFLLLRPGDSGNFVYGKMVYQLSKINRWFGVTIKVENEEIIKKAKMPFVLMANHQTSLDFLVILEIGPDRTATVAKRELLYAPVFGIIIWLAGTIFIDRKASSAVEAMRKAASKVKENNTNVWVFPEGTRTQIDGFLPFKKGGFHLAIQAQIPVIPVVIGNYRNIIDRKNRIFDSGTIYVKVLEPITTEGLTTDDAGTLTEECRNRMLKVFEEDSRKRLDELGDILPLAKEKAQ